MAKEFQMKSAASLREILRDVAGRLEAVSDSPRLDAELLLAQAIDVSRSYFFAHPEDIPDAAAVARLASKVERRLRGEPMAYITGQKEFWSLELAVTPATLVPRPETEVLVELALREIPRNADWKILDLGTGSGAIAVALASERPLCTVTAVDCSDEAIEVAEQNVRHLGLGNVECIAGNWTEPVQDQTFDLIVSNPPYVAADSAELARLASEPRLALVAGADGLDAVRTLAEDCRHVIRDKCALMLEHGSEQESRVQEILAAAGWADIETHNDLAGLPRISTARKIAPTSTND